MTAINPIAQATATASTPGIAQTPGTPDPSSTLSLNFASYLKILTAQLKNQDPTNATDPNQFTQELVQFGGVQQQIATNQTLQKLVNAQTTNSLATGVGYIGNYVAATSTNDDFAVQGGHAEFGYTLTGAASTVNVSILDSKGNTVGIFTGTGNNGTNFVSWDGKDNNGNQMPDGTYTFQVAATNGSANVAVSNPLAIAKVTGVQSNTDGTVELLTGSLSVSSSSVNAVYTPNSLPNSTALAPPKAQPSA